MRKTFALILAFSTLLLIYSCSKKHHSGKTVETSEKSTADSVKTGDSLIVKEPAFKPKRKDIIPKTIIVNDNAARKSVDGRLYYDLLGHRYWKNYKDGKYYLFNKSMYSNDAFKPL